MARFSGKVGYIQTVESEPGYWEEKAVERTYFGDITRNMSHYQPAEQVNDNIVLNNTISIVADPYANENFQHMRYVTFMGNKWKITNVEIEYPRLILTIGGIYNGYEDSSKPSE